MDAGTAGVVGAAVGGLIGWTVSVFQRRADSAARRQEREYELLIDAVKNVRLSMARAVELDHSRSWAAMMPLSNWPTQWPRFLETVSVTGASVALIGKRAPSAEITAYLNAIGALWDAKTSDRQLLATYLSAATDLRRTLERRARDLAGLPHPTADEMLPFPMTTRKDAGSR